jgi:hypothetical protein
VACTNAHCDHHGIGGHDTSSHGAQFGHVAICGMSVTFGGVG